MLMTRGSSLYFFASSADRSACEVSVPWSAAFPMSCSRAARLTRLDVQLELRRQESRQRGHLLGVGQLVLGVAVAVLEPPDHPDQLGMHPRDPQLEAGLLARLADVLLDFLGDLLDRLLDPGRVDAAVLDQALDGHPRDLPPDGIEPGEDDRLGRVVHDDVDPGRLLQRPDVPAFPTDDPALHVVAGQIHHRHRRLGDVLGGNPADGAPDDLLGALFAGLVGRVLDALDPRGGVQLRLLLQRLHQLGLGLLRGQTGHHFQLPLGLGDQLATSAPPAWSPPGPGRGAPVPGRPARARAGP